MTYTNACKATSLHTKLTTLFHSLPPKFQECVAKQIAGWMATKKAMHNQCVCLPLPCQRGRMWCASCVQDNHIYLNALVSSLCAIPKQGNIQFKVIMVLRHTNKSPTWACDMLVVSAAKTITDCVGTDYQLRYIQETNK